MQNIKQNFYTNKYIFIDIHSNTQDSTLFIEYKISTILKLNSDETIVKRQLSLKQLEQLLQSENITNVIILHESEKQKLNFTDSNIVTLSFINFVNIWISITKNISPMTKQYILNQWNELYDYHKKGRISIEEGLNHLNITKIQIQKNVNDVYFDEIVILKDFGKFGFDHLMNYQKKFTIFVDQIDVKEGLYECCLCQISYDSNVKKFETNKIEVYVCNNKSNEIEVYTSKIAEKMCDSIIIPMNGWNDVTQQLKYQLENKSKEKMLMNSVVELKPFVDFIQYVVKNELISDDHFAEMLLDNANKLYIGELKGMSCSRHKNKCHCCCNELNRIVLMIRNLYEQNTQSDKPKFKETTTSEENE